MSEEPTIEERPPWKCPECGCEPAISCAMYGRNGDRTMRCKRCTDNFNSVAWLQNELAAAKAEFERLRRAASRVCYAHELQPSYDNRELENKYIRMTHADSLAELRAALVPEKVAPPPQSG
jgi:hypothetical protein